MTVLSRYHLAALTLGAAMLAASQAQAETLTLQVQVADNCSVQAATMDFGVYQSNQTTQLQGTANLQYSGCPGVTRIALGQGTTNERRMARVGGGEDTLRYNLLTSGGEVWGDGVNAQQIPTANSGTMVVIGTINPNQAAAAGTYTDSVTMSVVF